MVCCVIGNKIKRNTLDMHREMMLRSALWDELEKLIYEDYSCFLCGIKEGLEIDMASHLAYLKKVEYQHISLEIVLSRKADTQNWDGDYYSKYVDAKSECDKTTVISPVYCKKAMEMRNRYMIDQSDLVLVIWNGIKKGDIWNAIQYAQSKGKNILLMKRKKIFCSDLAKD